MKLEMVEIGRLCNLINGRAFKPTEWRDSGLPIIRIQNLNDETKEFNYFIGSYEKKHHVINGDLLFSWSGTPGTSFGAFFWNRGDALLNQHIFNVKMKDKKVFDKYFKYAINGQLHKIIDQSHGGVGLKHITKGKLEATKIPLPTLPIQKKIVQVLDKAQELIDLREKQIQLLDDLVHSIFYDMFGDLYQNGKSWKVIALNDVSSKITDGTHKTPKYVTTGITFLSAKNVKKNLMDLTDVKYITIEEHLELTKRCKPEINDILITKSGSTGSATLVDTEIDFSIFESLALIKYHQDKISGQFLKYHLNDMCVVRQFKKINKGGMIKSHHELVN